MRIYLGVFRYYLDTPPLLGVQVACLVRTALLYWSNFNSQPSHAHVRFLLYTLGVPLFLVHVMTPIAILLVFMITCALSLTMRLLTNDCYGHAFLPPPHMHAQL